LVTLAAAPFWAHVLLQRAIVESPAIDQPTPTGPLPLRLA
jgi:hypothetical protein